MREIKITKDQEGRRFDKFLFKYLNEAPASFIYKMLRKKNITLNGKKSDGSDILSEGDIIKIFMTDETISNFSKQNKNSLSGVNSELYKRMSPIVYEDENLIIAYKPKGMLSQKAEDRDISFNEIALSYIMKNGENTARKDFTPSICNRLDRNTEGLIIFAKTYMAAREISDVLKDRSLHKFYRCIVMGEAHIEKILTGNLSKDNKSNKVSIKNTNGDDEASNAYTKVSTIWTRNGLSELEILLLTGKTHQIRAQLASIGHPLIGDSKYGNSLANSDFRKRFGITSQMLVAYKIIMPNFKGSLKYLSGREFEVTMPNDFIKVRKYVNVEV